MTCQELVDFLMAYLDRELATDVCGVFEDHLRECPSCLAYLESYQQTMRLGRAVCVDPDADPPDEVPEELVRAILAARGGS